MARNRPCYPLLMSITTDLRKWTRQSFANSGTLDPAKIGCITPIKCHDLARLSCDLSMASSDSLDHRVDTTDIAVE